MLHRVILGAIERFMGVLIERCRSISGVAFADPVHNIDRNG